MKILSREKLLTLTLTLPLVLIFSLTMFGATHEVSKEGTQFGSIQGAIDVAVPEDTVKIREGTYKENLSVDKDLTIKGVGTSQVKIDGQKEGYPVLHVGPSEVEVTVKNLTLHGAEGVSEDSEKGLCPDGLTAVGGSKIRVEGIRVEGGTAPGNLNGIQLRDTARANVKSSEIKDNFNGIRLESSAQATVETNKISSNGGSGIKLSDSAQATVLSNSIRNNNVGISIYEPKKFKGTLEGFDNRITFNVTDFEGVLRSTQKELISELGKTNP